MESGSAQFLARVQQDLAKRESQKQINELKKTGNFLSFSIMIMEVYADKPRILVYLILTALQMREESI